jgi:hypothetical protein
MKNPDSEARNQYWHDFISEIDGCSHLSDSDEGTFDCLRNLSANTSSAIAEHISPKNPAQQELYPWAPSLDSESSEESVLPDFPSQLNLTSGEYAKVPILAGSVLDEGTDSFLPSPCRPIY